MRDKKIVFINKNFDLRGFYLYVNGNEIEGKENHYKKTQIFKYNLNEERFNILLLQKHPYETLKSTIFEMTANMLFQFLNSEDIGYKKAILEGEVNFLGDEVEINIELIRTKKGIREYIYNFHVSCEDEKVIIKEIKNEFLEHKELKRRVKIINSLKYITPILLPVMAIIGILFLM